MKYELECAKNSTNRRGFFRSCLGTGSVLAATPIRQALAVNARSPFGRVSSGLTEYERILRRTKRMDVLGQPRSWSVVTQGFHPFSPERTVVMPSEDDRSFMGDRYGDRCGRRLRRRIDDRIDELIEETKRLNPGDDPLDGWFPDSKRESIYRIMDVMTDHYGVRSEFEAWVVGLAERELLASTAWSGCGMAHQFQHGGGDIPVDCPPVDWWLFLFPDGIDWSALDEEKIFAVIAHVARDDEYARSGYGMPPTWALAERVWGTLVDEWPRIARMDRIEAARHLNPITADLLDKLYR